MEELIGDKNAHPSSLPEKVVEEPVIELNSNTTADDSDDESILSKTYNDVRRNSNTSG